MSTSNIEKQQIKVVSSKTIFSKEAFLNYIGNKIQIACLPVLKAYHFFQIGNKIKDNMSAEDYRKAVTKMVDSGERVWAFLAFRYWDRDLNGYISNNDIF